MSLEDYTRDIDKTALLKATRAAKLQLRWLGKCEISVICNPCSIEAPDIMRKIDHSDQLNVSYVGFP